MGRRLWHEAEAEGNKAKRRRGEKGPTSLRSVLPTQSSTSTSAPQLSACLSLLTHTLLGSIGGPSLLESLVDLRGVNEF